MDATYLWIQSDKCRRGIRIATTREGVDQAQTQDGNHTHMSIGKCYGTWSDAPYWSLCRCDEADTRGDEGERGVTIELDIIGYFYGYQKRDCSVFSLANWI